MGKILHFRQLETWQEAHKLGSLVVRVVRASDSPTCWGRHAKNPNKFGTLIRHPRKLPNTHFFILSQDLGYISSNTDLMAQSETVGRLLNGLIASTERRQ